MDGTTLCPHCKTRFKVSVAQLKAHQGMVRCGHCLQAFDARSDFIPDTPHPQLELTMSDSVVATPVVPDEPPVVPEVSPVTVAEEAMVEEAASDGTVAAEIASDESVVAEVATEEVTTNELVHAATVMSEFPVETQAQASAVETLQEEVPDELDFRSYTPSDNEQGDVQVSSFSDGEQQKSKKPRAWLWGTLSLLLLLLLLAQAAYFLRADIAAHFSDMRPALVDACKWIGCTVELPKKNDMMSIESSSLEADANNATVITLTALLRNRADYPLAYPNLELTLNDRQDKPVARRVFKPAEYLPPVENEQTGLQANHEINLKLSLDTGDLSPVGYRLLVFYPRAH